MILIPARSSPQTARASSAIFKHKGKVTVFVPHYAMSGGTLLALAADEIVMCEHAVLGPVDPQLGGYPAETPWRKGGRYRQTYDERHGRMIIQSPASERANSVCR